jgi:hypothetical protein
MLRKWLDEVKLKSCITSKNSPGGQSGPHLDVSASIGGSQFLSNVALYLPISQLPAREYLEIEVPDASAM